MLSADLKILLANRTFCTTFHVSQAETKGCFLYHLGNEQWNIPRLRELLEEILPQNNRITDFEVEHDFPEIGWKTMLVNGHRVEDISGRGPAKILLSIIDITEKSLAEKTLKNLSDQLAQQARIFNTTLSSISDFAYIFDREGRFLYANRPLLNLWGLKLEEAMGKTFFELNYPKNLAAQLHEQIQQVFSTGHIVSGEMPYTGVNGVTGYYEYIFNPVMGADGEVELVAGSTRDLTERKAAEAALIKSEKLAASGRLAAALAHEINNPLQAVANLVSLLGESSKLDSQGQTYAKMAEEELDRVTHLTRQSLSFYRETTTPTAVNVEEVLEAVINLYGKKIEAKEIVLSKQYDSNRTISSYPGEIRQIFTTLLVNAVEAVPTGGTIAIKVHDSHRWKNPETRGIRIAISDNGIGILAPNMARIFEPFFTTKGQQGTGLGLWVTQGIVSRLGGSIRVRSSAHDGKSGTSFSIFLPYETPAKA